MCEESPALVAAKEIRRWRNGDCRRNVVRCRRDRTSRHRTQEVAATATTTATTATTAAAGVGTTTAENAGTTTENTDATTTTTKMSNEADTKKTKKGSAKTTTDAEMAAVTEAGAINETTAMAAEAGVTTAMKTETGAGAIVNVKCGGEEEGEGGGDASGGIDPSCPPPPPPSPSSSSDLDPYSSLSPLSTISLDSLIDAATRVGAYSPLSVTGMPPGSALSRDILKCALVGAIRPGDVLDSVTLPLRRRRPGSCFYPGAGGSTVGYYRNGRVFDGDRREVGLTRGERVRAGDGGEGRQEGSGSAAVREFQRILGSGDSYPLSITFARRGEAKVEIGCSAGSKMRHPHNIGLTAGRKRRRVGGGGGIAVGISTSVASTSTSTTTATTSTLLVTTLGDASSPAESRPLPAVTAAPLPVLEKKSGGAVIYLLDSSDDENGDDNGDGDDEFEDEPVRASVFAADAAFATLASGLPGTPTLPMLSTLSSKPSMSSETPKLKGVTMLSETLTTRTENGDRKEMMMVALPTVMDAADPDLSSTAVVASDAPTSALDTVAPAVIVVAAATAVPRSESSTVVVSALPPPLPLARPDPHPLFEYEKFVLTPYGPGRVLSYRVDRQVTNPLSSLSRPSSSSSSDRGSCEDKKGRDKYRERGGINDYGHRSDDLLIDPPLLYAVDLFRGSAVCHLHEWKLRSAEGMPWASRTVLRYSGVSVTWMDTLRLWPLVYLNDNLVNFYLRYLVGEKMSKEKEDNRGEGKGNRRNIIIESRVELRACAALNDKMSMKNDHVDLVATKETEEKEGEKEMKEEQLACPQRICPLWTCPSSQVHVFPTYFYTRISYLDGGGTTYRDTARGRRKMWHDLKGWTKGTDIFSKRFLLFPVNYDLHWTFVLVCNPGAVLSIGTERGKGKEGAGKGAGKGEGGGGLCDDDDEAVSALVSSKAGAATKNTEAKKALSALSSPSPVEEVAASSPFSGVARTGEGGEDPASALVSVSAATAAINKDKEGKEDLIDEDEEKEDLIDEDMINVDLFVDKGEDDSLVHKDEGYEGVGSGGHIIAGDQRATIKAFQPGEIELSQGNGTAFVASAGQKRGCLDDDYCGDRPREKDALEQIKRLRAASIILGEIADNASPPPAKPPGFYPEGFVDEDEVENNDAMDSLTPLASEYLGCEAKRRGMDGPTCGGGTIVVGYGSRDGDMLAGEDTLQLRLRGGGPGGRENHSPQSPPSAGLPGMLTATANAFHRPQHHSSVSETEMTIDQMQWQQQQAQIMELRRLQHQIQMQERPRQQQTQMQIQERQMQVQMQMQMQERPQQDQAAYHSWQHTGAGLGAAISPGVAIPLTPPQAAQGQARATATNAWQSAAAMGLTPEEAMQRAQANAWQSAAFTGLAPEEVMQRAHINAWQNTGAAGGLVPGEMQRTQGQDQEWATVAEANVWQSTEVVGLSSEVAMQCAQAQAQAQATAAETEANTWQSAAAAEQAREEVMQQAQAAQSSVSSGLAPKEAMQRAQVVQLQVRVTVAEANTWQSATVVGLAPGKVMHQAQAQTQSTAGAGVGVADAWQSATTARLTPEEAMQQAQAAQSAVAAGLAPEAMQQSQAVQIAAATGLAPELMQRAQTMQAPAQETVAKANNWQNAAVERLMPEEVMQGVQALRNASAANAWQSAATAGLAPDEVMQWSQAMLGQTQARMSESAAVANAWKSTAATGLVPEEVMQRVQAGVLTEGQTPGRQWGAAARGPAAHVANTAAAAITATVTSKHDHQGAMVAWMNGLAAAGVVDGQVATPHHQQPSQLVGRNWPPPGWTPAAAQAQAQARVPSQLMPSSAAPLSIFKGFQNGDAKNIMPWAESVSTSVLTSAPSDGATLPQPQPQLSKCPTTELVWGNRHVDLPLNRCSDTLLPTPTTAERTVCCSQPAPLMNQYVSIVEKSLCRERSMSFGLAPAPMTASDLGGWAGRGDFGGSTATEKTTVKTSGDATTFQFMGVSAVANRPMRSEKSLERRYANVKKVKVSSSARRLPSAAVEDKEEKNSSLLTQATSDTSCSKIPREVVSTFTDPPSKSPPVSCPIENMKESEDCPSTATSKNAAAKSQDHPGVMENERDLVPCMIHFDSGRRFKLHKSATIFKHIRKYINACYEATMSDKYPGVMINTKTFPGITPPVPQQENARDCGVYMLEIAERVLSDPPVVDRLFVMGKGLDSSRNKHPRRPFRKDWFGKAVTDAKRVRILALIHEQRDRKNTVLL